LGTPLGGQGKFPKPVNPPPIKTLSSGAFTKNGPKPPQGEHFHAEPPMDDPHISRMGGKNPEKTQIGD